MNQLKRNNVQNLEIEGIGGWLILLAYFIVGSFVVYFFRLINITINAFLNLISTLIYATNKILAFTTIIELIGYLFLFLLTSYILYLFFWRKKEFPRCMNIFFISNLCFQVIVLFFNSLLKIESNNSITIPFIFAIIWSLYLTKSARVKNTFKN